MRSAPVRAGAAPILVRCRLVGRGAACCCYKVLAARSVDGGWRWVRITEVEAYASFRPGQSHVFRGSDPRGGGDVRPARGISTSTSATASIGAPTSSTGPAWIGFRPSLSEPARRCGGLRGSLLDGPPAGAGAAPWPLSRERDPRRGPRGRLALRAPAWSSGSDSGPSRPPFGRYSGRCHVAAPSSMDDGGHPHDPVLVRAARVSRGSPTGGPTTVAVGGSRGVTLTGVVARHKLVSRPLGRCRGFGKCLNACQSSANGVRTTRSCPVFCPRLHLENGTEGRFNSRCGRPF